MNPTQDPADWMKQGAALHRAGRLDEALVCFERARALKPDDSNIASACATLLGALGQPEAAFRALLPVQTQLMATADGAANLAIAAEACGQTAQAVQAYDRALQLDPDHLRALNNTAILAAERGDYDLAVTRMQRCLALAPDSPQAVSNLVDMQMAARRFDDAVELLHQQLARFAANDALAIRLPLCMAFAGRIDEAQAAIDKLGEARLRAFREMLQRANTARAQHLTSLPQREPDAWDLFCQQAFEAHQQCDWRDHARVTAVLREMLARCQRTGQIRDWRDAAFYGLMLPLHEDEMLALRQISMRGVAAQSRATARPFRAPKAPHPDGRIHVGIAPADLRDPRVALSLLRQAQQHDSARFALHVYSSSPRNDATLSGQLASLGVPLVEIGHMSHDEAVGRIRVDSLDVYVDAAFNSPWCRPEIVDRRVAPIQMRQITWHRHNPPPHCDYNLSDRFIHPDDLDLEPYGAIVRLPHTLWLAGDATEPDPAPVSRADLQLPADAVVLCCLIAPVLLDPQTFATWMKILAALPKAVLWLPAYPAPVRRNLAREARAAGIDASRLLHLPAGSRPQTLARIAQADLFVDTLRFNANHGLVDALRMGVPAVSCAGNSMASRLGGSIIRAAGLPEMVCSTPKSFVDTVVRLGQDASARQALRARLADARPNAALFSTGERVREWEWAWTEMVRRHREGLPAAAFDVPAQGA